MGGAVSLEIKLDAIEMQDEMAARARARALT